MESITRMYHTHACWYGKIEHTWVAPGYGRWDIHYLHANYQKGFDGHRNWQNQYDKNLRAHGVTISTQINQKALVLANSSLMGCRHWGYHSFQIQEKLKINMLLSKVKMNYKSHYQLAYTHTSAKFSYGNIPRSLMFQRQNASQDSHEWTTGKNNL